MIYLVYGTDEYRVNDFVKSIKKEHNTDGQNLNIINLGGNTDIKTLANEVAASPFLGSKRLVIMENFIKKSNIDEKKAAQKIITQIPDSTTLLFVEETNPDQRTSLVKDLKKTAKTLSFEPLSQNDTINWIKERVSLQGGTIDNATANLLFQKINNNLGIVENEIIKLVTYDKIITKENIENLVDPGFFNNIFELMDAISNKNQALAQKIMLRTLESEENNEFYIISMLSRQIRNLQIIKDLADHRLSESEIVNKTKLHPFVVSKTIAQTKHFTQAELRAYQQELLEIEIKLKTASINPKLLILKLTAKMASKK